MKRKDPEHAELPEEDREYSRHGELGLAMATYGEDGEEPPRGVAEVDLGEPAARDVHGVVVDMKKPKGREEPPK